MYDTRNPKAVQTSKLSSDATSKGYDDHYIYTSDKNQNHPSIQHTPASAITYLNTLIPQDQPLPLLDPSSRLRQRNLSPQPIQRSKPNNRLPLDIRVPPLHPLELLRHPRKNIHSLERREDLAGTDSGAAVETAHASQSINQCQLLSSNPIDRSIPPSSSIFNLCNGVLGVSFFFLLTANTPIPV